MFMQNKLRSFIAFNFFHFVVLILLNIVKYSECPKTEGSVWETKHENVRLSNVPISDRRAVWFVGF